MENCEFVGLKKLSEQTGFKERRLWEWARNKTIPSFRTSGTTGKYLFNPKQVMAAIAKMSQA